MVIDKAYVAPFCNIGYIYTRKATAIIERLRAYARDTVGYRYAREAMAKNESLSAYARDAVADYYAREVIAIVKRTITYARDRQTFMTVYNYFGCSTGTDAF